MESMKQSDSPMLIPADIVAKCDGPDQFQNFDRLFRKALTVKPQHHKGDPAKQKSQVSRKKRS
jgi:hypothetical protein